MSAMVQPLPAAESKIFPFSMEQYRKEFQQAVVSLGLDRVHTYQLRHGGAAEDLNARSREYQQVKARGRWMTDQSVRRYTKTGKVQQLLGRLAPGGLAFCQWCHRNLEKAFRGQVLSKQF